MLYESFTHSPKRKKLQLQNNIRGNKRVALSIHLFARISLSYTLTQVLTPTTTIMRSLAFPNRQVVRNLDPNL